MSLIEQLQQVQDFRTQPRYPLWVVLLLVVMGTMSGCFGYRALADFVARHQTALLELMELPHKRLPSYSTIRQVMVRINFESLTDAFNAWASETVAVSRGEQMATDGKSIKASLSDYEQPYQDFVSVVSAFGVQSGMVRGLLPMHNGSESEISTVQDLLSRLNLSGVCFTLDALHTQKNG
ncbi:MAG: ISAs1 family transposase ISMae8 [Chroococcidiopsis cubana SAG 39.79]|uniref:H repeat-associated protein N-terminal domain-containing protein n=1 Tax=Chroococcidiopsis cubana SAG 39.79 TaxID=388085 RepID=A0AB37U8Q1_9CYAN|nr:ISAs1 family transposase [Chroococcidiopsis cubana]MDZ4876771.1 ISAs1 family transposase ISMae8 [Chroococcidiopsis cubana SAG 39.79]PSB56535.1 hypothetical protein C7B79_32045 [Chroococcidiopsis cubana CCALA 043]RUS98549.1 hypothetical protein DSM107010_69260 [Chroococcidiopsis cubana SAG 39.79]